MPREAWDRVPTILRIGRFRFHFYSDERGEPGHVHVATADGECKFWLEPIGLAGNKGMRPETVRQVERLVYEHVEFLKEKYHECHHA
jgi:hypothetical protein